MTGRHPGANLAIAVVLCLCVGFAVGGAAGSSSAGSAADEPTAERTLNTTAAEPGETVRVTATVTRDSAGPVDYLDEFEPAFADDASLVSLTANGDPISESLLGAFNDTIIVSAGGVPTGTVTVTYDVTVPVSATSGEIFSFDGFAQTGDGNDDETSVGGDSTLVVGSATPTFKLALSSVPSSVTVGEELTVEATVTNTGDGGGTQQIGFAVDGEKQENTAVTLDPGESKPVSFDYTTVEADTPAVDVAVSSANETVTETVTVSTSMSFGVVLSSIPESVSVGAPFSGTATVINVGGTTGTQQVTIAVGGAQVTGAQVTLAPGANESLGFDYTVTGEDAPEFDVAVSSANETATGTVTVLDPPLFAVSLSAPGPATPGAELSLTATVTNTGDARATQTVSFAVDGVAWGTQTVELAGGAGETVTFGYTPVETGERNLTVATGDETASASVRVLAPANFDVRLNSVPEAVEPGETTTLAVAVENTGGAGGTRSVALSVGGDPVFNKTLALAGGEAVTLRYNHTAGTGDPSTFGVNAVTPDDTASAIITIRTNNETLGDKNDDDTGLNTNLTGDDTRAGTDDGSDEDGGAGDGLGPGFGPGALVLAMLALVMLGLGRYKLVCAVPGLDRS